MLEAATSSVFFPFDNWVSFWKEYFLQIMDFKVEKGSFCSKQNYSAKWRKHGYLSKKTISVKCRSIENIDSLRVLN